MNQKTFTWKWWAATH